jgi:hypothetical protein
MNRIAFVRRHGAASLASAPTFVKVTCGVQCPYVQCQYDVGFPPAPGTVTPAHSNRRSRFGGR